MALSSNSVIHFTKTKENLMGILEKDFQVKYCLEEIIIGGKDIPYASPIISFCDIPLSEVKNHINNYGTYGIGLTKEWAKQQRLNPVSYIEKNSFFSESLLNILASADDIHTPHVLNLVSYIKNYENILIRENETHNNYRFADEKEWRYVPDLKDEDRQVLTKETYLNDKDSFNQKLKNIKLTFTPNDIKYIIIDNESEIKEFLNFLRNIKGHKYSWDDIERLGTRIITSDQIKTDF